MSAIFHLSHEPIFVLCRLGPEILPEAISLLPSHQNRTVSPNFSLFQTNKYVTFSPLSRSCYLCLPGEVVCGSRGCDRPVARSLSSFPDMHISSSEIGTNLQQDQKNIHQKWKKEESILFPSNSRFLDVCFKSSVLFRFENSDLEWDLFQLDKNDEICRLQKICKLFKYSR